jgi:hypothetical protein
MAFRDRPFCRIFGDPPEGCFEAAEQKNGLFVERVLLRRERGLREIVNGKVVR